jgi:lipoprotein-anchoring transpeptidase ErfK/SrfK
MPERLIAPMPATIGRLTRRDRRRAPRMRFVVPFVLLLLTAACSTTSSSLPATPRTVPSTSTTVALTPPPVTPDHPSSGGAVAKSQALAILSVSEKAMSAPSSGSTEVGVVQALRPITHERTTLPVLGRTTTGDGTVWLDVLLPGRPDGHSGWITEHGTSASSTAWHLVVDTTTRRVFVYDDGQRVETFVAIVGEGASPTPLGNFFVEEDVALSPSEVGAPYALALSARSNVYQEFDGGPGQVALHGLANVGGVLGSAASHGCVRLGTAAISWLVLRIGPGVPVTIID